MSIYYSRNLLKERPLAFRDYIPLWYGFVDESGDPAPFSSQPLILVALLSQSSRPLELLIKHAFKKTSQRMKGGELKASRLQGNVIEQVLNGISRLPVSIIGVEIDKRSIVKPPEDAEELYSLAAARLARMCLERYPRLELHFDKRYSNVARQRWLERWIRDELADYSGTSFIMVQDDSTTNKPLQAADFLAWAAGKCAHGDHKYWEIVREKIVAYEIIRCARCG